MLAPLSRFWAVFALGRSIVGAHHAVMAVLLMTGIIAFLLPTPEFGPSVLAMPLTALDPLFLTVARATLAAWDLIKRPWWVSSIVAGF